MIVRTSCVVVMFPLSLVSRDRSLLSVRPCQDAASSGFTFLSADDPPTRRGDGAGTVAPFDPVTAGSPPSMQLSRCLSLAHQPFRTPERQSRFKVRRAAEYVMLERSEASFPGQALRPFAVLKGDNETALPKRTPKCTSHRCPARSSGDATSHSRWLRTGCGDRRCATCQPTRPRCRCRAATRPPSRQPSCVRARSHRRSRPRAERRR